MLLLLIALIKKAETEGERKWKKKKHLNLLTRWDFEY